MQFHKCMFREDKNVIQALRCACWLSPPPRPGFRGPSKVLSRPENKTGTRGGKEVYGGRVPGVGLTWAPGLAAPVSVGVSLSLQLC